ncbi:hypothetical protein P389DRAFT_75318 [Cystobasidium minutum MCA 4210]|uniref:uncharacterized protein n=1 Tax=Cystobasidium minutum MCA 4210 TaxID=1397322 RepID=UPI0034CD8B2F|eukprot:jgi/Rhomi1/75318/CE75317_442
MSYEKQDGKTNISLLIPKRPRDAMTEPVEGHRRPDSPIDPAPGPSQPAKTQSPGLNRPPSAQRASGRFTVYGAREADHVTALTSS